MCGRYYRRGDKQAIAERFQVRLDAVGTDLRENYNIAPNTFQPVVRLAKDTDERELLLMRWGLLPFFAKSPDVFKTFSTINARAETVATSPSFRGPFKKRRCLVPFSGFYEWKKLDAKTKQPYAFSLEEDGPFAFAGLWDAWHPKEKPGEWLQTFTIVTTVANELMAPVHDRMPVILHQRDWERWLDRGEESQQRPPVDLLRPYEAEAMTAYACNPLVGNVRNNGPEMLNSA